MCGHERMNIEMLDKKVKNVDKIHLSKRSHFNMLAKTSSIST